MTTEREALTRIRDEAMERYGVINADWIVRTANEALAPPADAALTQPVEAQWFPITTVPNTGEAVMFYTPGEMFYDLIRADDWHAKAWWLDDATHWMPLPAPPKQGDAA